MGLRKGEKMPEETKRKIKKNYLKMVFQDLCIGLMDKRFPMKRGDIVTTI